MASNGITFDEIRSSIVDYFKRQDVFKDYDFTSTATSILIDALAYLGHYVSVYSNFAVNESFLDTALQRSSVVSLAKNIGYTPNQYTSATAKVRMTYTGTEDLSGQVVPFGTTFLSTYNNTTYYFRTLVNTEVQYDADNEFYYVDLELTEGTFMSQIWNGSADRFVLSHPKIDTNYLYVTVYNNSADTVGTEFSLLTSANQLTESFVSSKFNLSQTKKAPLYLLNETTQGYVEVLFGDDILSRKIEDDNIVKVTFLASSGSAANGIAYFSLNGNDLLDISLKHWNLSVLESSHGGGDWEDIEQIRINAPKFFQRQGRNVVAEDYKSDILHKYGNIIDAVNVWGGEDNDPPSYGMVYACIKPKNATVFTDVKKSEIAAYIKENSVIGITLKILDPDIIYVDIDTTVTFDKIKSTNTAATLKTLTESTIKTYFTEISNTFNSKFVLSKFLTNVYAIDSTIDDVDSSIKLTKNVSPVRNQEYVYEIDFQNEIEEGSLTTSAFYQSSYDGSSYRIIDDGEGNVNLLANEVYSETIGTIDYDSGLITITYTFATPIAYTLAVTVKPSYGNMKSSGNSLFSLSSNSVTVESI